MELLDNEEYEDDGSHWRQFRRYCYICGLVGRVPLISYPIVRWHLRRVARRMSD